MSNSEGSTKRARQRRKRGSQQLHRAADGTYSARVTMKVDGETVRRMVQLGTDNLLAARRKLARLRAQAARGVDAGAATAQAKAPLTFETAETEAHARWKADGLKTADERHALLARFALPTLGELPVTEIRAVEIRAVLESVQAAGRSWQTIVHTKNAINAVLAPLWRDELLADNPCARVRVPHPHEEPKARAVLTDEELRLFLGHPAADLETKMAVLLSRTVGGMRSGDVLALDWTGFGPAADGSPWGTCRVPRRKGRRGAQVLEVPEAVRPFLAAWHASQGEPTAGPMFPVSRGPRAGEVKRPTSYAKRLRVALKRALGVSTFDPTKGQRGQWVDKPESAYTRRERELFLVTDSTLPVDFHSTRRAYCTALARANVVTSVAQVLAGHTDGKVHQRYIASETIRALPAAAMLALPPVGNGAAYLGASQASKYSSGNTSLPRSQRPNQPLVARSS